jgi:signal transduction histidine kinase
LLAAERILAQADADRAQIDSELEVWRAAVALSLLLFALFAVVPAVLHHRSERSSAELEKSLQPAAELTARLGTLLAREAALGAGNGAPAGRVLAGRVAGVRAEEGAVLAGLRVLALPNAARAAAADLENALASWHASPPDERGAEPRAEAAQEELRRALQSELEPRRQSVARADALTHAVLAALSAAAVIAALLAAVSAVRLARILRRTRGVTARVVRLQVVTEALSRVLTPDEAARAIVYQGLASLGAQSAYLALAGPDGKTLYLEVGVGAAEAAERAGSRVPLSDRSLAAAALHAKKPLWLGSARERKQQFPDLQLEPWAAGCEAWVALPLLTANRPLGVLALGFSGRRTFPAESRGVPLVLSRLSVEALQRSTLYAEAEEASRLKSGLIMTMSHEIRTPLNSVLGYVELLSMGLSGPVSEGYLKPLDSIRGSARQILHVVEDVLAYLQVDTVEEGSTPQWVELPRLLEEVMSAVEPRAAREGVRLQLRMYAPPDFGRLELDAPKVRRILTDLMENAVTFAPAGRVELVARLVDGEAVFEVHDSGVAIEPEEMTRIFEPRAQPGEPLVGRMGLPTTRRLTRLLGGSISVASRPGEGNAFTVHLPTRSDGGRPPAVNITASPSMGAIVPMAQRP